jgi:hypothetical protein
MPSSFLDDVQTLINAIDKNRMGEAWVKLVNRIQSEIDEKREAEKRRRLYETAKTATNADDRDIARNMYFESRGIHKDFQDPKAFGDK